MPRRATRVIARRASSTHGASGLCGKRIARPRRSTAGQSATQRAARPIPDLPTANARLNVCPAPAKLKFSRAASRVQRSVTIVISLLSELLAPARCARHLPARASGLCIRAGFPAYQAISGTRRACTAIIAATRIARRGRGRASGVACVN
ncbi:hypothetical protein HYPSUDRAFT_684068 [Hypholoma sublateritium FD-334 SS-4]|uniref:Uncharacterized protein n=1 Tax=Hypholoma sublateritium (strain FD-334 SS-4) TaxID=945553 RepID=A0A0D2NZD4_HYPSF|nr:hypothetical protein HYPSUDRAFT_684068 [Hypholoma sublateritium FD-334 SS-4]